VSKRLSFLYSPGALRSTLFSVACTHSASCRIFRSFTQLSRRHFPFQNTNKMRFSTGLTLAAAVLCVDARAFHWHGKGASKDDDRPFPFDAGRPYPTGGPGPFPGPSGWPMPISQPAPTGGHPVPTGGYPFPTGHPIPSGHVQPTGAVPSSPAPVPTSATSATEVPTSEVIATTFEVSTRTRPAEVTPSTSTSTTAAAATTTAAAPPPSTGLTEDEQNALDAHNSARSEVGAAPLVWDADLAAEAQAYAEELISVGSLVHSGTSGQGENLYGGSSDATPCVNAANMWIGEKSSYSGEVITESNYQGFGHYTQIVWGSTTHVGMGVATGPDGATYVVARYSPPGNMLGETAY
jgi:uncharacterized protein YkwD